MSFERLGRYLDGDGFRIVARRLGDTFSTAQHVCDPSAKGRGVYACSQLQSCIILSQSEFQGKLIVIHLKAY